MTTATEAKERAIIFSAPMVRAILDGRKTMTRRIVSWENSTCFGYPAKSYWPNLHFDHAIPRTRSTLMVAICGDDAPTDVHLSVPWRHPDEVHIPLKDCGLFRVRPVWEIGDRLYVSRRKPRVTLEVTGVKVERVQDIPEADAVVEGIANGDRAWDRNGWVWAMSFRRVEA